MKKKLLFILISVLCLAMPLAALATTVDSGSCGEDLRWTLNDTGVLTISGSGAMEDYTFAWNDAMTAVTSTAPWYPYASQIYHVEVQHGVARLGNSAFAGLEQLSSVSLPSSLSALGENAFYHCSSLPSISLPVRVTRLPDYVFGFCASLKSIGLQDSLLEISDGAFDNCTALTSFTIPANVTKIGWNAFSKTSLTSIVIPDSVTTLDSAFSYCEKLEKVVLPQGLQAIDGHTFIGCERLSSIHLPDGVETIGDSAFEWCSSLKSVALSPSLTTIEKNAFAGSGLERIEFPAGLSWIGVYAFDDCNDLTDIKFNGTAPIMIGNEAFAGVKATVLYSGASPSWTKEMRSQYGGQLTWQAFDGTTEESAALRGTCGSDLTWTLQGGVLHISGMGFMDDYEYTSYNYYGTNSSDAPWGKYVDIIRTVVVDNGVLSLGDYAFQNCVNLSDISLPTSIARYGKGVFASCMSLESFTLPYGIRSVPEDMFYACEALKNVTLPQTVETIEENAFAYSGLESIKLPGNLKTIGRHAFGGSELTSITLPDSVTTLGVNVFMTCLSLKEVVLGKNLQTISDLCFHNTIELHKIIIPGSVRTIGREAFGASPMYLEDPEWFDCSKTLIFQGDLPDIAPDAQPDCTFTFRYPYGNETWEKCMKDGVTFGGKIVWEPHYSKVTIDDCIITVDYTPAFYTGKAIVPQKVTVTYQGNKLTEGKHYKLKYVNNINAGEATVQVIGLNDISGTGTVNYQILKQYPTLTFKSGAVTCKSDADPFTNTLTAVTDGVITYSSSNTSVATVSSKTGKITIKGVGVTTIYAKAAEGSNYLSGMTSFMLTVEQAQVANPLKLSDLSFSFSNSSRDFAYKPGYRIPLSRYKNIYSAVEAKRHYENAGNWGGSCYGMSVVSCLLNLKIDDLEVKDFNKSSIWSLTPTLRSPSHDMILREMIETMQISWGYSGNGIQFFANNHHDDVKALCEAVSTSRITREPIVVAVYSSGVGHAIVAYDIEKVSNTLTKVYVYDVNYPGQKRYIRVTTNKNGEYTGWYYSVNDMYPCGSAYSDGSFAFYHYNAYANAWNARLNRDVIIGRSSMYVDSDNFEIRNHDGALVAYMKDGRFTSYVNTIFEFVSPDPSYHLAAHLIYLPTEKYTIVNKQAGSMKVTMINRHQSATVITTAGETSIDVSDLTQTNMVYIRGKAGDSYSLSLESDLACAASMKLLDFNGAFTQDTQIQLGTEKGELYVVHCDEIAIWRDGEALGSAVTDSHQSIADFTLTLDYTRCSANGEKRHPAVFVRNNTYELQEHKDFIVIYSNDTEVGTATASVYGVGAYGGVAHLDYEIIPAPEGECTGEHAWNQGVLVPDADSNASWRQQECMVCGKSRETLIPGFLFRLESAGSQEITVSLTNTMKKRIDGTLCIMVYDARGTQLATEVQQVNLTNHEQAMASVSFTGSAAEVHAVVINAQSLFPQCELWTAAVD